MRRQGGHQIGRRQFDRRGVHRPLASGGDAPPEDAQGGALDDTDQVRGAEAGGGGDQVSHRQGCEGKTGLGGGNQFHLPHQRHQLPARLRNPPGGMP